MKVLAQLLKQECRLVGVSGVLIFMLNIGQIIWFYEIGRFIEAIEKRQSDLRGYLYILLIITAINLILIYVEQMVLYYTSEKIAHNLRMGYVKNFINLNLKEKESFGVGNVISRYQNEISEVIEYIRGTLFEFVSTLFTIIITVIYLILQNLFLTVVIMIPIIGIIGYVTWSSKLIQRMVAKAQDEKVKLNEITYAILDNFSMLKLFDALPFLRKKHSKCVQEWKKEAIRAEKRCALYLSLSGLLSHFPLLLLLFVGGSMVVYEKMSFGALFIFLNLSKNLTRTFMNMPEFIASFRRFETNLSRIQIN